MTRAVRIARSSGLLGLLPKRLKLWARARLDFEAIHQAEWRASYDKIMERAQVADAVTTSRVCIVRDWMLRHAYYEAACRELGVPYEVLDLTTPDWLEKIARTDFSVYFVRPFVLSPLGRALYEERTWFLEHVLRKNVVPGLRGLVALREQAEVRSPPRASPDPSSQDLGLLLPGRRAGVRGDRELSPGVQDRPRDRMRSASGSCGGERTPSVSSASASRPAIGRTSTTQET